MSSVFFFCSEARLRAVSMTLSLAAFKSAIFFLASIKLSFFEF